MLKIEKKLPARMIAPALRSRARKLVLPFVARGKSRQKAMLADGTEAGLFLPRGTTLRGGDLLIDERGGLVEVEAAPEEIYRVRAARDGEEGAFDLLRAAYHLGNRHVPVELEKGVLKIERDPVLRDLLLRLGMRVEEAIEPFEPEAGAYGGGHRHDHDEAGGSVGEQLSREAHAHQHEPQCGHGHEHQHEHQHEHEHEHQPAHRHDHACGHEHHHSHEHTHDSHSHDSEKTLHFRPARSGRRRPG